MRRAARGVGLCRRLGLSCATVVVAWCCGCSSTDKSAPKTVKELLEENSTLLYDLASYESVVRNDAVERLKSLGREQGTAVILHLLRDPTLDEERVEIVLARVLASWKDRRAIPYLLQFLDHPDLGASRNASEGLLEFGTDPRIMARLEEMLASEVVRERRIAAGTLVQMRGDEVFEVCAHRFRLEDDHEVRATLLVYVAGNRSSQRKLLLIEALDDPREDIRWLAWRGLQDYEDLPAVDYFPRESPDANKAERKRILRVLYLWQGGASSPLRTGSAGVPPVSGQYER